MLFGLSGAYIAVTVVGLVLATHWRQHFNQQLSVQMAADIAVVCTLMFLAGGVSSGLSVFLLVSLAAASLVGRGRLVLLYAALATVSVLLFQTYGIFIRDFDPASIVQAGFISAGFFATAILARMLGQRVMVNEDLARRRGIALDNQIRISQRVVERMQDGVLIVTVDGLVSRCNPVASAMLGLSADAGVQLSSDAPALAEALRRWVDAGGEGGFIFAVRMAGICRRALSEQQVQMAKCWFFWKMSGASRNVLSS